MFFGHELRRSDFWGFSFRSRVTGADNSFHFPRLTSVSLAPEPGERDDNPLIRHVDVIISRFMARHGLKLLERGVRVFSRPKLLHELVTPEDEQELVQRRRPDQHQFLLPSMWGSPITGPNTPDGSSPIQGSAFDLEVDED